MKWTHLDLIVTTNSHVLEGTYQRLGKEFVTAVKKAPLKIHTWKEPTEATNCQVLVSVPTEFSVFDFHTALRKVLPYQKKTEHLRINTTTLPLSVEETALTAVGTLVEQHRYQIPLYGKKQSTIEKPSKLSFELSTSLAKEQAKKYLSKGVALGKAMNLARYLSDLPGNELMPKHYLSRIKSLAKGWKLKVKTYTVAELQKLGAGAFLAVVRADLSRGATIAKLTYRPKKTKTKGKIALVGKGLCYDTGGYNIKTGDYMYGMHRDMGGSGVALSLMGLIAEFNLPFEVDCYLAIAENLISPTAFRPNDVVNAMNGLSIEVVNTDAEGRMVLSDTLALASREKPDLLIDFATLTGSAIRSIGTSRLAVFPREKKLEGPVDAASDACGENIWRFPMGAEYEDALKSDVADLRQISSNNYCDHIYAATFLSHFVEKGVAYVHVDLSSDTHKGGLGLSPHDVTSSGVRFGHALIEKYFNL